MARTGVTLGFTAVGALAGSYFGNPMLGAQLGFVTGSIAGALLFPPEGQQGPRLGDLRVADASYGTPIPIVYGTARVAGTMIWTAGIEERSEEHSMKGGGPQSVSYSYYSSFAVGLCEGPIGSVRKLWLDTKLVYDVSQSNTGIVSQRVGDLDPRGLLDEDELDERRKEISAEIAAVQTALTFYLGTEEQLPDPVIEAKEGPGVVPAHRGLAYVVLQDLPLMYYGNRIPNISAEVVTTPAPAYPRRTVTPTLSINTDQMVFDQARQELWAYNGGDLTAVDGLGNTVARSAEIDFSLMGPDVEGSTAMNMGFAIDQDGALYVPTTAAPNAERLARVDPLSFAVTHINVDQFTLLPEVLGPCSCLIASPTFVWWASFFFGNLCTCFFRPGALNPQTGEAIVRMAEVASIPYALLPVEGCYGKAIAIAPDETAWLVCSPHINTGSAPTYLVHMQATGAAEVFDLSASVAGGGRLAYDPQRHALLVKGALPGDPYEARIARFDIATGEVDGVSGAVAGLNPYDNTAWRRGVVGRELWVTGVLGTIQVFDVDSLTIVREVDTSFYPSGGGGYSGLYDPSTHAFWQVEAGTGFAKYFLDRLEPQPVTLASIVSDLSRRAGLAATDIATGPLTDPVHGFVVSQQSEARAALEAVLGAFLADGVETDWALHFGHRTLAPVATLTVHDLGAYVPPASTLPDVLTPERLDDQALPIRVDVSYADPERNYQDSVQHARRMQAGQRARSNRQIRTPVILTGMQARQLAEQSLAEAWVSRMTYRFLTPYRWTTLDPGDVVTLSVNDRTTVLRLTHIGNGANGLLEMQAVGYDSAIYTASQSVAVVPDAPMDDVLTMEAPTALFLVDTHLLRDIDDGPGYYLAMAPQGSGEWHGATVFSSLDASAWREEATMGVAVDYGSALNALAVGSPYVIDSGHTLDVVLARGALASISVDELLNGANAGILGQEILQWQTATPLEAANTWRLSNLLRGRRGTEWAIAGHMPGERFLVLSAQTVRRDDMGLSEVGTTRLYRAVTFATDVLTTSTLPFKNTALGLKPYSPDHVRGTRTLAGDLTIQWSRRTRLGGLWVDGREVLLGETSEAYEVDILEAGGAVQRTLTSTTPSVEYPASMQTTDGRTPGDPVPVVVYQIGVLGRGWGTETTI